MKEVNKSAGPPANDLVILPHWLRYRLDLQFYSIWTRLKKNLQELPSQSRILDIGSGWGAYKALLESHNVSNVDPHFPASYKELSEIREDENFDIILLIEVLEHLPNPEETLSKIRSHMHSQSELWLSVPFAARYHRCPEDFQRWTHVGLRRLLEDCDYKVKTIHSRGNSFHTLLSKSNVLAFSGLRSEWFLISLLSFVFLIPLTVLARFTTTPRVLSPDPLGYFVVAKKS